MKTPFSKYQQKAGWILFILLLFFSASSFAQSTLYTYQSGNWNDPDVWTTDPGGTTLAGSRIPGNGDAIVVLPSRTLLLTADITNTGLSITINQGATLDAASWKFTNSLASLSGQGTFRLGTASFPSATTKTFTGTAGGTVEYYCTSDFSLPSAETAYYNLVINCTGKIATLLSNITIHKDLEVRSGTFRINDGTAIRRTLVIKGNLNVGSGASLLTGTGNTTTTTNPTATGTGGTAPFIDYYAAQSHRIELYGDLNNNGTVRFTNQAFPVFNAFPPNGFATVYFMGATDNTVTCNGRTDFYNLVVDKGADQTFVLTINSAGYDKFRLFGANNASEFAGSDASNPNIRKALWIRNGTLRLNGYTFIPSLVEGSAAGSGDFFIPGNGALLLGGPDVVVMGTIDDYSVVNLAYGVSGGTGAVNGITTDPSTFSSSVSLYGKLQVNEGRLYIGEIGRIIYYGTAAAQFIIRGGTIDIKQFQSVSGGGKTAFWQEEGKLILRGRFRRSLQYSSLANLISSIGNPANINTVRAQGTDPNVGTLNLDQDANIFHVEGGSIDIWDPSGSTGTSRALEINSEPENISVTGGTINIYITSGTSLDDASYGIASKASLYNLNILRSSGTQSATLLSIPSKSGVTGVAAPPLRVIGNMTLANTSGSSNAILNAAGLNLVLQGNIDIQANAVYTPGNNRTILNGTGLQVFTSNGTITSGLHRLIIDKSSGIARLADNVVVRDSLVINNGTLDDGGYTIQVSGHLYNAGTHSGSGKIQLTGTSIQDLAGGQNGFPAFGNLEIANYSGSAGSTVAQLGSNISVNSLSLTSDRVLYIGSYTLTVGAGGIASGLTYSIARMIRTNGLSSDGGVKRYIDNTYNGQTVLFPVGCPGGSKNTAVAYFPGRVYPGNVTSPGYITVVPVSGYHPSCEVTKTNSALDFYWKTKLSGLQTNGTGHLEFDYRVNIDNSFNDPYYLLAGTGNWGTGTAANNKPTLIFPVSINIVAGEFTSGKNSPFADPRTYYSRQSGRWDASSGAAYTTWSLASHTGAAVPSTLGLPRSFDNVVIGGVPGRNDSVTIVTNNVSAAIITIKASYTSDNKSPVLNIGSTTGHSIDIIRGGGKLCTSSSTIPSSPTDYGDFLANDTATFHFYGGSYTLPASITSYPNLLITGNDTKYLPGTVTVRKNLMIADGVNSNNALSLNPISGNLSVYGNLCFRNGGKLLIPASSNARDVNIFGDIDFTYGGTSNSNSIQTVSGAGTINRLNFFGSHILSGASGLTLNPANSNKTDLYIKGSGNTIISKGTVTLNLNRIFIQKNQVNDTVHFINNFTLNEGANNTSSKSITLSAGTLILSDPSAGTASTIDLNLTSGGTSCFLINSLSRLILRNGSIVRITGNTYGSGVKLDGLLAAEGSSGILLADGTANNTGYIEYTGSGNSSITLNGTSVFRAAQVRRSLSLTTGILKYSQSGTSSATFYGTGDAGIVSADRAKLEITGAGSSFSMNGNPSIFIENGGGTSFGDLFLRPEISNVTGGNIVFGTDATGQVFKIDANVPLFNLTVNTAGALNELQLMVNPLVLRGSLKLSNANTRFTAGNINISIAGDLINNGTFTTGSNNTLFNGATQVISGVDPLFWNLTVNPAVKLKTSCDITVRGALNIISGILETTDYNITAKGNILNNGSYTNNPAGTSRLYINGSALQHIAGTGSFGRLEIDNPAGAKLDNDLNLTETLKLSNGNLDINQFGLTLGPNSFITGGATGLDRMIMSDGVFSNLGIKKYFNAGYSGTFVFPSGVNGKYTPASLNITSTGAGFVRMNIINSKHPATLSPYNVLRYYWEAESSVTGFDGSITFSYSASDITGDESQYVAGRLIIPPGTGWSKAAEGSTTDNVNEFAHSILFNFPAGTSNLGGQYTAGYTSDLPNTIPVYTSNTVLGNWDNPGSWSPVAPAGGPNGFSVVIREGDTIRTNGNKRFSYKTTINGKLDVGTSYGHNLGTVDGTGILALQQANLPAGNFHNFLGCSGGSLEYGGSGTYTIVADRIDTVRNLSFRGTGTRILPDKNLVICNRLLIKGPVLNNQFNRKLSIGGSFDLESGSFLSGSGNDATVAFNGTVPQTVSGFRTANPLNNLEINNPAGLTLNSAIMVKGNLILTRGLINTTADSLLKMTGQGGIVSGGNSSSYVNGPMSKNQLGGIDFTFPVGKSGRYGKIDIVNPQTGVWEAEYYNNQYSDLTIAGTLVKASAGEYWRVKSPADGKTTAVRLRWDSRSDINPATTSGGITDLRVAEYDGADWREKTSANQSGNDTDGTVQTASNIPVSSTAHPKYYTLGSSSPVKPTIVTGAVNPVYRCTTTGYLPYSSLTGSPDQYMIDFDNAANAAGLSDVTWTLLPVSPVPFTIPAGLSPGVYTGYVRVRVSSPLSISIPYLFTISILPDYRWTGAINSDWNTAGNWLCGNIPPVGTSVQIPNVTNKPVLNAGSLAAVNDLEILAGSSLTISGNTLRIAGTITNNGSFNVSAGKIELNGTVAQTIPAGLFAGNSIKDLTVNNSAGVTMGGPLNLSGILLLQSGNLSSNGNLTLVSTAAGTASIDGAGTGQVTGNMTLQRFISNSFGYKYFSSPFQSATVAEFGDDVDLLDPFTAFYAYDEDREFFGFQISPWYDYNDPANLLKTLEGYAINFGADPLSRTVDITGAVNNGPVTINLTNSNNPYSTGFNLVGNPYPSAINWNSASGWIKVNIDNALYYFNSSSTDQYAGTYSSWINGVSSDGIASGTIPSMQGFIVHVTDGAYPVTGTLAMDNRVRVNNLTQPFYSKGAVKVEKSKSGNPDNRDLIRISAQFSDLPVSDAMTVYFDDQATTGFDSEFDALKLFNSDSSVPSIYSAINEQTLLSITAMPHSEDSIQRIPLGISLQRDGDIIFSLSAIEGSYLYSRIILIDELKKEEHDLLTETGYKVPLVTGDHKGRFFLSFEKDLSTGVKKGEVRDPFFRVYSSHGIVYADINTTVKGQGILSLSSVSGQTLYSMKIYDNGHYEFNPNAREGIYICSFVTGGLRFSEKIYIRQQ